MSNTKSTNGKQFRDRHSMSSQNNKFKHLRAGVPAKKPSRYNFRPVPRPGLVRPGMSTVGISSSSNNSNNNKRVPYRNTHYRGRSSNTYQRRNTYMNRHHFQQSSVTTSKKRLLKPALFVLLKRTNNNIFMCLSRRNGVPLYQTSGGSTGISGSKRDTPASAETATKALAKEIVNRGYSRCYLLIDGVFDNTVRGAVRGLQSSGQITFVKLQHLKTVAHNGVRKSKPRRT